jgi:hypothetical protein
VNWPRSGAPSPDPSPQMRMPNWLPCRLFIMSSWVGAPA